MDTLHRYDGKAQREKAKRKRRRRPAVTADTPAWIDDQGLHAVLPGTPADQETLDRMTQRYQEQIRNSPLWDEIVQQFGPEKAEQLLREFRAELR